MRYFVFLDESGEANISRPDPRFNIFVLCGIVFREDHYEAFKQRIKELKIKYFGTEDIVFHSTEMRRYSGPFKIFQDRGIYSAFLSEMEAIMRGQQYSIISCVVNKDKYHQKYPTKNIAYEEALTFIVERCVSFIGENNPPYSLLFCLEKRSELKDRQLKKIYTKTIKYGTDYKSVADFKVCHPNLFFKSKNENINGLQFADLCAYPIARKSLTPESPQPTFEVIKSKFWRSFFGRVAGYGLKHFP